MSGQLEAEIFALAFTNCYTFGPTFRAENSNTPRHLAEFWMIEPEMAFCDLDGDRALAEAFLKYVVQYALDNCAADLEFFNKRIDNTVLATLENVATSDFAHITYTEAIAILEKSGETWEFPVCWGVDLQSEHERYLTEKTFGKPVIVTDYPKEIKAFYMRLNDDDKNRAGDGCFGSAHRRDYRWFATRGAARCFAKQNPGAGVGRIGVLVVSGTKEVRNRAARRFRLRL